MREILREPNIDGALVEAVIVSSWMNLLILLKRLKTSKRIL